MTGNGEANNPNISCTICSNTVDDTPVLLGVNDQGLFICSECLDELVMIRKDAEMESGLTEDAKYRYHWEVVTQDGVHWYQFPTEYNPELPPKPERSILSVPLGQAKEIKLNPQIAILPRIRLRIGPGEMGSRYWQMTQSIGDGKLEQVRNVLKLSLPDPADVYLLVDADGSVTLSTSPNC